nr:DNA photolyase, N-terminal [Tanacetum cinerariifolium]
MVWCQGPFVLSEVELQELGEALLPNYNKTAGHYIPGYSSVPPSKERKTSGIAWFGARGLSFYLRLSFRNLVKRCYPTITKRADEGLLNEMVRASYDPGVLVVLEINNK